MREQNNVLRNKTGMTSLPFKEYFFEVSYNPSKVAEINAKIIHIKVYFNILYPTRKGHCLACSHPHHFLTHY